MTTQVIPTHPSAQQQPAQQPQPIPVQPQVAPQQTVVQQQVQPAPIMTGTPDFNIQTPSAQVPPVIQTPPADQNTQIMEAITKINQRLDGLAPAPVVAPVQTIDPLAAPVQQQTPQVQQPAQVQVPTQNYEEVCNDQFYDNPHKAMQEMIRKSEDQKKALDNKWSQFYTSNTDLQNNKNLVDLTLEKHKTELHNLPVDKAFDKLAEYSRGYKAEIVGQNIPTEIVPTNNPTILGASGTPVPQPVQQPEEILSFADQMNAHKATKV